MVRVGDPALIGSDRPLVAHIVFRLDIGGLENGVVNLINHMPVDSSRHVVISLAEPTEFATRIQRSGIDVYSIGKRAGKDPRAYVRLYRLLRRLRPDVVHTRNLGTLDCQAFAWIAGVPRRIHGEHGWDTVDQEGSSMKYRLLRRLNAPFVQQYIALSREIEHWLVDQVGVDPGKVTRICNGVDTDRFRPIGSRRRTDGGVVIGTVTRLSEIKDPLNTLNAFAQLKSLVGGRRALQLLVVGDGPLRVQMETAVRDLGLGPHVTMAGRQLDVVPWLDRMDLFVMGSRREGISNTILEAMAAGLPVVATRTGGNHEIVEEGVTGALAEPRSSEALANAMLPYVLNGAMREEHGRAARQRAVSQFSLERMIASYAKLYSAKTSGRSTWHRAI
jgi:sugar transferase (PEP-CTERM/EpsH1 system associated)